MGNRVMHFHKYHGCGNDFVVVDNMNGYFDTHLENTTLIRSICHRRFGVGSDGFLALLSHPAAEYSFELVYLNPDGAKGMLCGNGCICAIAFAKYLGLFPGKEVSFLAADGRHDGIYESDDRIHLRMIDVTNVTKYDDKNFFVFNGAAHHVCFVKGIDEVDAARVGREIRHAKKYREINGANVNFVQGQPDGSLRIRSYLRGVEDEIFACGTGAVAAALAHNFKYKKHSVSPEGAIIPSQPTVTKLHAIGGEMTVSCERAGPNFYQNIYLTGSSYRVYSGQYYL